MRALADDPSGAGLDAQDRAVHAFAGQAARDASSVTQEDVDALRAVGLSDADAAHAAFAAAARSFFTRLLAGHRAPPDAHPAATSEPDVLTSLVVGRPVAGA